MYRAVQQSMYHTLRPYEYEPTNFTLDDKGNEQWFLTSYLQKYNGSRIHVQPLDALRYYASGVWYKDAAHRSCHVVPVAIQNNWIVGNAEKVARLQRFGVNFGQWFLANDTCVNLTRSSKWKRACGVGCPHAARPMRPRPRAEPIAS